MIAGNTLVTARVGLPSRRGICPASQDTGEGPHDGGIGSSTCHGKFVVVVLPVSSRPCRHIPKSKVGGLSLQVTRAGFNVGGGAVPSLECSPTSRFMREWS